MPRVTKHSKTHRFGMRLKLEGKSDRDSDWGVYSTVIVEQLSAKDTLDLAYARALRTLNDMAARWVSNFDHSLAFRIIEE